MNASSPVWPCGPAAPIGGKAGYECNALGGLPLYGAAQDLPSVIGILMLMGIVTKNAILPVGFIIEKRRHGRLRGSEAAKACLYPCYD
ncbi:MAG: efflux RND transporter permease subunit [Neisseria sp.]|nr:efflux RND transporter permease subunit [Neisseria sp.]